MELSINGFNIGDLNMRVNLIGLNTIKKVPKLKQSINQKLFSKASIKNIPIVKSPIVCYDIYNENLKDTTPSQRRSNLDEGP